MILSKYQVIKLERYNKPAIFLGFDKDVSAKLWVVRLNEEGNPIIDWFNTSGIDYVRTDAANKTTVGGRQIFYGKFRLGWINGYYHAPSDEEVAKFGAYLKVLVKKEGKEL